MDNYFIDNFYKMVFKLAKKAARARKRKRKAVK